MNELHIAVILGTAREGRESEKAARFIFREAEKFGFITELVDVRDHMRGRTIPPWEGSEVTKPWREIMERSDGLIVVSPEYNHGYPGELKMALDQAYQEYARKPVALCGVSSGPFGGARMIEQLRQIFAELQMVSMRNAVYFSKIGESFDEAGEPKDLAVKTAMKTMLDEFIWYAQALKDARKK